MFGNGWVRTLAAILTVALCTAPSTAQFRRFFNGNAPPAGSVNLPYAFNDASGNTWRVYNSGWLQSQGNAPVYSQGAMLTVSGNQPQQNSNTARLDDKTGEVILENMPVNNVNITRRILFDKENNLVRYIEVFKNTLNQDQTIAIQLQSNFNFGINAAQYVPDPKKKDQNMAWVAQTGNNISVLEVYSGKGAKVPFSLSWPQGNNFVQASMSINVPAGKEVAMMHLYKLVASQDAGIAFCNTFKEAQMMKTIPNALRKIIVNFPSTQGLIGEVELLRGEMQDIVELRSGDQFRGTLKETAYPLTTSYGPVNVPVEKVVGIVNVGQFRPRQLVVTSDGQIFGGRFAKETIDLQLASGQSIQIPIAQISRVGYRKRAGEPEEWTFDRPMVQLRTGERMIIKAPDSPLDVATRYGKISLKPESVAAISFQNEDNGVHEIFLTDGSKFAGLFDAGEFGVTLDTGNQAVKFPSSSIARLQLTPKIAEADDLAPTIRLMNDDVLVGTVGGQLKLDTAFDTIAVNATEIRSMTRVKEGSQDIQVVLWDGTTLSGQLQETQIGCQLNSGTTMNVPVVMLEAYDQPQPRPSPSMVEKIRAIIADLNADDWKQRDRAQAQLISMGPVAEAALKELRVKQPPEAQKSIDIVLQKLEAQRKREKPGAVGTTAPVGAADQLIQLNQ